ncbi:MAG: hypothetical protein ACYC2K_13685 [Gemmatimonadales bacterium]
MSFLGTLVLVAIGAGVAIVAALFLAAAVDERLDLVRDSVEDLRADIQELRDELRWTQRRAGLPEYDIDDPEDDD